VKRYVKALPLSEPLCRPASHCFMADRCQRRQQQHNGAQKLGDFKDRHYHDGSGWACRMFVAIEFADGASPPPPRHFKHWSEGQP
jgi:hypothetical protein